MSEAKYEYECWLEGQETLLCKHEKVRNYVTELEQQNEEMRETQLKLAQEVIEWRLRFNELSKELSEVTGKQRITVIEETKEQIIFMAGNRE